MKRVSFIFVPLFSFLFYVCAFGQDTCVPTLEQKVLIPAFTILEALYDGQVKGESVDITAEYKIRTLKKGRVQIPLLSDDIAITEVELPKEALFVQDNDRYRLIFSTKGEYTISIKFVSKLTRQEDKSIFSFKLPEAAISKLTLNIPGTGLDIESTPALNMQITKGRKKTTQVTSFLGTAKNITIRWSSKASTLSAAKPMFLSENNTLITISPGIIRTTSILNYKVMQGKLSRFKITLPNDVNLLTVKGDNLKEWNLKQTKTGQLLEIELSKAIVNTYKLTLRTEETKENITGSYKTAEITTQDAQRQTGHIAISTKGNLKARADKKTGISQIDPSQLPEELIKEAKDEISLAYKYLRKPMNLSLAIDKIKPEVIVQNNIFYQIDEELTKLYLVIKYDIRKAGIFDFSIGLPKELTIIDVVGNDIETWTTVRKDNFQNLEVQLKNKALGKYSLLIKMEKPVKNIAAILKGIEIPKVKIQNAKKVIGYIGISNVSNLKLMTKERKNLAEIDIEELISAPKGINISPSLAFKFIEQPYELKLAAQKVAPRVTAETFTFLSVGEGLLLVNSAITYDILHAGIDEFNVVTPKGISAIEITGKNIKSKEGIDVKKGGDSGKIWRVKLHSKAKGKYTLYCSYEKLTKGTSGKIDLPKIKVLGVERETGYYCLGPRTNVEIKADEVTNAAQIDIKELPQDKIKGIDVPLVLAFKYVRHPYNINIDVKKHRDVSVLVAIAESAQITTVLTKDGQIIVDAFYMIKNRQKQHLDIALPKDANIWSTFVNNMPIKSGRTKEGHIVVPLEKSQDKETMFPVEIVYATKQSPLKILGKLKMTQPKLDIPITNVLWKLYLPEKYTYAAFGGNLEIVKKGSPIVLTKKPVMRSLGKSGAVGGKIPRSGYIGRKKKESGDYKYREGEGSVMELESMSRASIRNDLDFSKNIRSQVLVYQQRMEPKLRRIEQGKQIGVLPIKVNIPTGGKLFTFNKIFSSDELLYVDAFYAKGVSNFLITLLIVVVGILLLSKKNKIKGLFTKKPKVEPKPEPKSEIEI